MADNNCRKDIFKIVNRQKTFAYSSVFTLVIQVTRLLYNIYVVYIYIIKYASVILV